MAALNSVSVEVPENAVYGLIGPNGAGKTTAIRVLMNLTRPSSGRAEVLGVESTRLAPGDLARIGCVAEEQVLPDRMTVGYLLRYLKPFYPTWDDSLCAELVRELDLPPNRKLRHLSRGMRMKTALAAALARGCCTIHRFPSPRRLCCNRRPIRPSRPSPT